MTRHRRPTFSVQASALLSLTLILSLFVTSVVYACSGLRLLHQNSHHVAMSHESVERGPCSESKEDICKSVRDRMLSLQPRASQTDNVEWLSILSSQLAVDSLLPSGLFIQVRDGQSFYDPVLKPHLSIPLPRLRI